MADSNQGASPRQAAFDRIASIYGDGPEPKAVDPKSAYDDIARKTRVPANVLMALDEAAGGFDPARAQSNATRIAAALAENKPMDGAIAELVGDPERASSLMDRAYDIADELYPAPAAPQDRGTDGKVGVAEALGGPSRDVLSAAVQGIGVSIEAGGVLLDEALRFGADPSQDRPTIARGLGRSIGDAVSGAGESLADLSTDDYKNKTAGTAPGGNLLDPSSWTLGEDPSILGLVSVAAKGLGSMIPIVAAPGPRAAAAFGALMGGGEGVENGRKFVEDAAATLDDAGQPEIAKLPEYKAMVRDGRSHEDTVAELARQAENNAGFRQGIVAGLGGAATNRIMSKAEGWLGQGGRLTRAVKKGVAGAGEEGLQEAAEGVASGTGIQKATGADLDLMQDSFGDFVGGALAGGTMGGIAGAAMRGETEAEAPAPGPMDPSRGLPAPRPALPGPSGAAPDAGPARGLPAILTGQAPVEQAAPAQISGPEARLALPAPGPAPAIPLPGPTPMAPISAAGADAGPTAAPLSSPSLPEGAAVPVQPEVPMPPAPAPVAPAGPIEDISGTLAANLPVPEPELPQRFPDMKPGKTIDLGLPEGQNVTAVAVREEADGVVVRVNGAEQLLTPEQFDSARDLAKVNAEAAKAAAKEQKANASVQPSAAPDAAPEPSPASAMPDGAVDAGVGGLPAASGNDLAGRSPDDAGVAAQPDIAQPDAGQPAVGGVDAATAPDQLGAALTADPADKVGAALRIGISGGPQEYMTSKGKLKIGYTLTGVTKAEANKIDPYSIRTPTGAFVNKDRADAFVAQQGESIKDTAPVAAAAADVAPAPTDAQKEAGNYKKGHARWQGMDLSIETAKGQDRTGTDPNGREWSVTMPANYGDIKGTTGADGDNIDFYMGPNEDSNAVFVIDQFDADTGAFDEHKVMLGFDTPQEARDTYRAGFSDGKGEDRIGGIIKLTADEFKAWVKGGPVTAPVTRAGKERAKLGQKPPRTMTGSRETEDGYKITRTETSTTVMNPAGYGLFTGGADASDARIDELIAKDRKKKGGTAATDTAADTAPLDPQPHGPRRFDWWWTNNINKRRAALDAAGVDIAGGSQMGQREIFDKMDPEQFDALKLAIFGPEAPRAATPAKPAKKSPKAAAKERAAPATPAAPKGPQNIGFNVNGYQLREDENGVRSYVESGIILTESVGIIPGGGITINKSRRGRNYLTAEEWAEANPAPVEDAAPEQPEGAPKSGQTPAPGILGVLSQEKQDRVAELKAKLAAKARNQASSGIDPEYITLGGELVGLYIEAGVTRFGQMLRDFAATTGLSMKEAQAPMRAAYNHVRDDMDLNGEDISQFDSGEAVMAEVRKAIKAETQAAAADANPAPGQITAKTIRADVAVTARGREIPVRYALVEMDSLIPSQTDEGRANPAYDKALQPRDRSGNKSAEQVRQIAQNLNPALLGESPMASTGSPIILPTGEVLSGNGRTLALRQAPSDRMGEYRAFLKTQGYPEGDMRRPVLVRIADGMSMEDAAAFAREANERDTADMSVSEQAMVDAENLTPTILSLYRGGDVDAASNADFVRAFGKDVMAANDAGRMRDNEGRMTQDAVRRINGALLAKAYGDAGIVAAVLESTDSGIKSIGGALTDVAPVWAQMRAEVEKGTIDPTTDITADLVEAVKLIERARREARPLSDFLNQTDMFSGESVSPGAVKVLGVLYRDTGATPFRRPYGRDKMADALSFYAGEALKTTPGVNLLGESADAGAILSTAKGRINDQGDNTQDLFGQRPASSEDAAAAGTAGNEPAVQDGQAGVRGQGGSRDSSQGGLTDGAGENNQGLRQGGVADAEPQAADGSGPAAGDRPGGEVGGSSVSDQDGAADQLAGSVVADSAGSAGDATGERKGVSPGNFVIDASFPLGEGTPGQKIDANIAAIKLAKALTAENRYPTRAEQETLARYVGWGGLKRVFDPRETGATGQFGRAQAELKAILTPQEYRAAGRSTADAHYTSRTVVSAMWEKMRAFGFDGGRVLEPTIGAGNFVGLQPADLSSRSEWFASELDKVTGQIAKHLYPDATVFDGTAFERAPFRPGSIDVAIGNPPFGSDVVKSKLHPEIPPLSIHNYVIAKTGLLLRPGGIMGMVVTNRFLDTPNPQGREYLARHFNFLGAVRLPNTAFKANAGTEVTTDIVWFQKRNEGEPAGDLSWLETGVKLGNVEVNGYFAANPQMMLGTPGMDGTMYGGKQEFTLHDDGRDLSAALSEALGSIDGSLNERTQALEAAVVADKPTAAMAIGEMQLLGDGRVMIRRDDDAEGAPFIEEVTAETPWGTLADERLAALDAATAARDAIKKGTPEEQAAAIEAFKMAAAETGAFKTDGGRKAKPTKIESAIYRLADGLMDGNPFFGKAQTTALSEMRGLVDGQKLGPKKLAAMKQLLGLRRDAQALLRAEHDNNPAMEKMRKALAEDYRAFVKAHGFIGSRANDALIGGVPGIEAALETGYKPADKTRGTKERAKEAAILRKRIITPYAQIRSARTPADGLHISLRERGRLDLGFIASLTGSNIEAVTEALTQGENPQAFFDPARDEYVIADEYLSGNLAEKIDAARKDGRFDNVRALEAAMPAPKTAQQITPSIRSMWLPASVFEGFLTELGARKPKVSINRTVGMIETDAGMGAVTNDFGKTFATERVSAFTVFANAVKGKAITVYDVEQGGKRVKNETETTNANAAIDRMSAEFQKWAYVNADRQAAIVDAFNTTMNVIVPRKFDGVKYLTLVGANPEIQLRNSQKNGAWRQMLSKSTLLHHVVGAGKTFTAITAIMEGKRLGLYRKPMVAVPNHLVSQWARDFYALYPGANILAATEKDFSAKNRRKLIARMATGDYDAIIIGHSQLAYIDNDPAKAAALIEEQVNDLQESMEEAKRSGQNRSTVAQMQKRIGKLEDRLKALAEAAEKGENLGFTFLETGIDNLIVDEAQEFKNLQYSTAADRLVGMNSPDGSQKALDLYTKTRSLLDGDGSVAFLTGTPVSNSLVEIYTVMKYLAPATLREMGLMHYDSWASSFVQSKTRFEYTAAQKLKERNVLSGLVNLGPLSELYKTFADIVMRPDVERMYREQMEAQNERDGTNLSTRFPTPEVRGGGRQLVTIPASDLHKEYTDYLVLRMEGIKRNASDKDYMKKDNALWVLSDARKASIDIRTVDPTAHRVLESKVVRAGNEIMRIAKATESVKGAQMVFADSSVPLKNAGKDIEKALKAAWEKAGLSKADITSRIERDKRQGKPYAQQWGEAVEAMEDRMASGDLSAAQMDALEEWMNGEIASEGAGNALAADTGFSFYDDLKAYLVEQGMDPEQIAFIHDYSTAAQKSALFEAVNAGDVRVLIGSTFKMGAGTNAQQRLVALHHIDAPWRPSDMEQREGRIIRQGNDLYAADIGLMDETQPGLKEAVSKIYGNKFEVDIMAYTTEQTSDVVMWQVLERKANGIEQFLNATADTLIEEDGDADSYAEFMAQSTGNPVFMQKMQAEKDVREMEAALSSLQMIANDAQRRIDAAPERIERNEARLVALETLSFDAYPNAGASFDAYQKAQAAYDAARQEHKAAEDAVRERNSKLAEGDKKEKLPKFELTPPTMFDGDLDPYMAAVKEAILDAQGMGQGDPIKLGNDLTIQVTAYHSPTKSTGDGGKLDLQEPARYYATLKMKGDTLFDAELVTGGAIAKNPLASRALVFNMMPDAIRDTVERRIRNARADIANVKADLPKAQEAAAKAPDRRPLERKKRELRMLEGRARVAEVAAARARVGRSNRFADMDIKDRDLVSDKSDDAPLTPASGGLFRFTQGDTTLVAGFGAKAPGRWLDDADGQRHDQYWFEAVADDGDLVMVLAARINTKDADAPTIKVIDTFDTGITGVTPATKESRFTSPGEGRARKSDKITPADARRINAAARAELEKVGIADRIRVQVGGNGTAAGTYQRGVIGILRGADGNWRHTLDHEIIHALRDSETWGGEAGLFSRDEWRALVRAARADDAVRARVEAAYPDLTTRQQTEEMVAEFYADWAQGRRDAEPGMMTAALNRIRSFFRAAAAALRGEGFQDAATIMQRIADGTVGGRGPDGPGTGQAAPPREQRDTATAAFRNWFGDSKVVNADGTPMVVYHGTGETFEAFDVDKSRSGDIKGIYAAPYAGGAEPFATGMAEVRGNANGTTMALYMSIQNPASETDLNRAIRDIEREKGRDSWTPTETRDALIAKGFDGYMDENEVIAFKADQVKSVENRGTYETGNPNIREQRNMDPIRAAMATGRARAAGMVSREYWSKRPEVWSNLLTDAMGKDARFNILGLVPGQPLFAELGKNLMGAQSYLANKQAMDTDRNEWQAKAATTVDAWTKIGRKNPEANDRLMELMHDSTIAGVDPSKDDEWTHTNAESLKRIEAKDNPTEKESAFAARISKEIEDHQDTYARLRSQYDALPAEFKDLYSTIRDEYSAMADATDSALLASVQIATDIAAKKARVDHAKELRRIEDDGLKGSERDAAIEKADATLAAARERASKSGKARMIQMRAGFEANRMKGPYFPLTRFGNYFVTIRDADGAVISFSRFEKKGEQAAEIERAKAEGAAEGWKVSHGVLTDSADIRGAVDPVFIQEIETILAGTGASSDTMDAVWQHWLESLPDMSIRKSKIHRKGRSGFQKDAVRAFSSAMFHGAHNLARLKYGLKMDDNLNDAEAEAARQPDAERAGFVVREMRQRHAFTMKPTNNPIVTAGTSLAFVWYMGMSPASAMVNITQTTVFGIPIFATRFRDAGVTGSSAALMKAMQDFGQGRGWTEKSKNLTADEKDALRRAYERGTIDKTQAHDLAAVAESGVQYNPTREKAMRVIGFLFHHAERFNREVTFMAAYRLLRAEGKDMDAALEEADALVKKVHFDYQNTSRPRVMQGDFAKILLTFRNFTVNALYRLFRDSHQAIAGATPEERREARGQLVGITLSMMAHAGIKGTWGFGLLMALLGIFTGDDQEPEDWLQDVLLMEGDDPATAAWNWTMGMALNGVPGHVTGTNLTERLGMPNLWFRSPREGTEGQDVWTHYLNEVVGPVFGLGGQWMSGLSMIGDAWGEGNGDNLMRGAEKLVPNFISNGVIKPSRFGIYGANTYYGDPLMEVGPLDVIKTAMGFTPAELAERYAINAKLKAREKAIMGRRADIHKAIGTAINEGRGIPADVLDDMRRFNAEYPENPVTPDTIKASMGARARAKARNEFGAALNPKLNDRIRGDMPPAIYN